MLLSVPLPSFSATTSLPMPTLFQLSAKVDAGQVTLTWPEQNASTIYVYRDYGIGSKPIATLKPTDASYTDKPSPGPHTYGVLVVGKEGRISFKSSLLPVYVPSICESPNTTLVKLWIGKNEMAVNCQMSTIKVPPEIINSTTFVSIRPIIEAANGTLAWNAATKTATVSLLPHIVELTIGKNTAIVDGVPTPISKTNPSIVPIIKGGNTMLPFRFIVESLGGQVNWVPADKKIEIFFPMTTIEAIRRGESALAMLANAKLGPVCKVTSVEQVATDKPVQAFFKDAKVLAFEGDAAKIVSLMELSDPLGRKLVLSNLSNWLRESADFVAYKVSFEPLNTKLASFTTVVLFDKKTNAVIDATFLVLGLDFAPVESKSAKPVQKMTADIANYEITWPQVFTSPSEIKLVSQKFNVNVNGKVTITPPGCNQCSRTTAEAELFVRNISSGQLDSSQSAVLALANAMCDFAVKFDKAGDFVALSLKEGCGFFPGTGCPEINDKYADLSLEMVDMRPLAPTETFAQSAAPIKGYIRLQSEKKGDLGWHAQDQNPKSKDLFQAQVQNSPRPRKVSLKIANKKMGSFTVPALLSSQYPLPGPSLTLKVPVLNSPSGRQLGGFEVATDAQFAVTIPFDKPTGWFGNDELKRIVGIGSNTVSGEAPFECPCQQVKSIEFARLAVVHEGTVPSVDVTVRVNGDTAFNPPESEVELHLLRNDTLVTKLPVSRDKLDIVISDERPEPATLYMYCVKLYQNNQEIDQWCNPESITPYPKTIEMSWKDGTEAKKVKATAGDRVADWVKLVNTGKADVLVTIKILPIKCAGWKTFLPNLRDEDTITVHAESENTDVSVIVLPPIAAKPGDSCQVSVEISSGLQKKIVSIAVEIERPECAYDAQWDEGGKGIGGEVSPGITKLQSFKINNTGNRQNIFIVDFETDQVTGGTTPLWVVNFKDVKQGQELSINPGEAAEMWIMARPAVEIPDGSTITITVTVIGCGDKTKLTWTLVSRQPVCDFELDWARESKTKPSFTTPGDVWVDSIIITNVSAEDLFFHASYNNEGEEILVQFDNYNFVVAAGASIRIKAEYTTPRNARIGTAKIKLIISCGKSEKSLQFSINIKKQDFCWFQTWWHLTGTDRYAQDMAIDLTVYATIRVINRSKKTELFAVLVERSDESWETGFDIERGLKQTFSLLPGEDISKLILWIKAGKNTKIGDKCIVKITIKACETFQVVWWEVTCVKKEETDVQLKNRIDKPKWARDGSLAIIGYCDFIRKGTDPIKALSWQVEWLNADQDDAKLGKSAAINLELDVFNGMPTWIYEHRVPKNIIEKLKANGGENLKILITVRFLIGESQIVEKVINFTIKVPPK